MDKKKSQIYDQLKKMIITGEFKPGEIIEEKKIIEFFNVSRTPVKDALNILEAQGWIEFLSRKGIKIPEIKLDEIRDIFQVRYEIEPLLLKIGFYNIDRIKIRVIKERIQSRMEEENYKELSTLDDEFHDLILNTSANKIFIELLENIYEKTQRIRGMSYLDKEDTMASAKDHILIIDYIMEGDLENSCKSLKNHIEQNQIQLARNFF